MGRFGRGAGQAMVERITARTKRAVSLPLIFKSGELKSYDNTTGMIIATIYTGNTPQDVGPMPYFHEWAGDGYGDEIGLEKGMHVALLCVDREGHEYIAFGATFDSEHATLGAQPSERYIQDKRGSFIKWMADSSLRLFAAGVAYVYGATKVWLGADSGIDDTQDAVITKRYLDQWWSQQQSQLKTDLATWSAESLSAGSGAAGPTTLTAVASTGSSKVKAVQ